MANPSALRDRNDFRAVRLQNRIRSEQMAK
jgi:hypothetical protein